MGSIKVLFLHTVTRSHEEHAFDGHIGIWCACVMKKAPRASARRKRVGGNQCDNTIDPGWYLDDSTEELPPTIKQKMPWLEATFQQYVTTPHTGRATPRKLNRAGQRDGWNSKWVI